MRRNQHICSSGERQKILSKQGRKVKLTTTAPAYSVRRENPMKDLHFFRLVSFLLFSLAVGALFLYTALFLYPAVFPLSWSVAFDTGDNKWVALAIIGAFSVMSVVARRLTQ